MSKENRLKHRPGYPAQAPERVPPPARAGVTGEVPQELLKAIVADASQRSGRNENDVQVLEAESTVWNDGSLGCPQPGMMYTQSLVKGYRILLHVADRSYDYRATEHGHFVLCDRPSVRPPSSDGAIE